MVCFFLNTEMRALLCANWVPRRRTAWVRNRLCNKRMLFLLIFLRILSIYFSIFYLIIMRSSYFSILYFMRIVDQYRHIALFSLFVLSFFLFLFLIFFWFLNPSSLPRSSRWLRESSTASCPLNTHSMRFITAPVRVCMCMCACVHVCMHVCVCMCACVRMIIKIAIDIKSLALACMCMYYIFVCHCICVFVLACARQVGSCARFFAFAECYAIFVCLF